LLDVRVNGGFTDETVVGDTVVLVHHRLAALPSGGTKITYRAEVSGPDADELGPQISADFPQVLAALKVVAETGVPLISVPKVPLLCLGNCSD
jgi:hypothetical protein